MKGTRARFGLKELTLIDSAKGYHFKGLVILLSWIIIIHL